MILYKLGGAALQHCLSDKTVFKSLATSIKSPTVIVHGGGPEINALTESLGIPTHFIDGQRVTDSSTLAAVMMALKGKTNSELVAALANSGVEAVGMSGIDASLFECVEENAHLKLVGKISKINLGWLNLSLDHGYTPVIAPIGFLTHPHQGRVICNINADLAGTALAQKLNVKEFVFTTDTPGVLDDNGKPLTHLSLEQTERLITDKTISGGMAVKIRAALEFLRVCPMAILRISGGKTPEQISEVFRNPNSGTKITL